MKKILVVDDEQGITKMVKLILERAGYAVRTENKGSDAVAAAREFMPDMIFLDVMMPDMSGDEVAAELRDDPKLADIPFVFLTAMVTKEETDPGGSTIGGNVFLAKPVKAAELLETISKQLAD